MRREWLCKATRMFEDRFADNGLRIPGSILLTLEPPPIVFPSLWLPDPKMKSCSVSCDGFVEVYISPTITNTYDVLDVLLHELVHTVIDEPSDHSVPGFLSRYHTMDFTYITDSVGFCDGLRTLNLENYYFYIINVHGQYPGDTA